MSREESLVEIRFQVFWVGEEEERYTEFVFGCVTKSTDKRKTDHSDRNSRHK